VHPIYGSALTVKLKENVKPGDKIDVTIFYQTGESCSALQFLSKEQTVGKEHPYMFSQCQVSK
jgi:leukotriene-A4 hydrolase